ncbi:TatD family hydrolase [Clostridium sp.]|uniref:TatD family hydrolase n=1 Tax=Clostridium sp. TaxID=1506 RepID=UPI002FC6C467
MNNLIDFHIHIDHFKDYLKVYNWFDENNIYALFVTNLPGIYERCLSTFSDSKYVKFALGFNPQLAGEEKFDKRLFNKYLYTTKYIGEVGLDFSKNYISHKNLQIEIFDYICKKSTGTNKILSIHSRNAEEEVLEILRNNDIRFAVFHWYTGDLNLIDKIVEEGYYFSVNSSMLRNEKGRKTINRIPIERMLIETDAPYGKFNNKQVLPKDLDDIYNCFENLLGIKDFRKIIFNNLRTLLKIQDDKQNKGNNII